MIKDIDLIVGAMPNFVKAVVLYKVLKREGFKPKIVHTGKHYSNSIQEETSYLNVSCYTLRDSTERPITVTEGTNMLIAADNKFIKLILNSKRKSAKKIKFWDGKASERICSILKTIKIEDVKMLLNLNYCRVIF